MKQMTAKELYAYLQAGNEPVLIDVREEEELEFGMIAGAKHIPMQTVPGRLNELESLKQTPIVLICRSGRRSEQIGEFLEQMGFKEIINLQGGMNAWATEIDTSMTVY